MKGVKNSFAKHQLNMLTLLQTQWSVSVLLLPLSWLYSAES